MARIRWACEADEHLARTQLEWCGGSVAMESWAGDGVANHCVGWADAWDVLAALEGAEWAEGTAARIVGTSHDGAALRCLAEAERLEPTGGGGYDRYQYWVLEIYREASGCDHGTLELYYIPDGGW